MNNSNISKHVLSLGSNSEPVSDILINVESIDILAVIVAPSVTI
jgi:hypothetical protein